MCNSQSVILSISAPLFTLMNLKLLNCWFVCTAVILSGWKWNNETSDEHKISFLLPETTTLKLQEEANDTAQTHTKKNVHNDICIIAEHHYGNDHVYSNNKEMKGIESGLCVKKKNGFWLKKWWWWTTGGDDHRQWKIWPIKSLAKKKTISQLYCY